MLESLLGAVLASLGKAAVVQLAEYLHGEADKRDAAERERQRLALADLARENAALAWLLRVADDPHAGDLRVRQPTDGGAADAICDTLPAPDPPGDAAPQDV